jgi:putative DNA primase/helicase
MKIPDFENCRPRPYHPNEPAMMAAWPAEARNAPDRFPHWTKPDVDSRPRFVEAGDQGPKIQSFEKRCYAYRQGDTPVRIKIMRGNGKEPLDVYRVVSDEGKTGWQARRPDGFRAVPYFLHGTNPFDAEGMIYWTGDEQDADIIARAGLPAFTFGGLKDGLPGGCEAFVHGRDVVIVAGNDKAGREHAEKKAALAARVAHSVRVVNVDRESDGVAERLSQQAVSELLKTVAAASPWQPPGTEIADVSLVPAQAEGSLQLPALPGGSWKISRVALQMLLDGDRAALGLYHAGNRRHPSVVAYFERLRRGEFG